MLHNYKNVQQKFKNGFGKCWCFDCLFKCQRNVKAEPFGLIFCGFFNGYAIKRKQKNPRICRIFLNCYLNYNQLGSPVCLEIFLLYLLNLEFLNQKILEHSRGSPELTNHNSLREIVKRKVMFHVK